MSNCRLGYFNSNIYNLDKYHSKQDRFSTCFKIVEQVHYFEEWEVGAKSTFCKVLSCHDFADRQTYFKF